MHIRKIEISWLVDWLVGFYGISTFVGYLMSNPFYANKQFYFKQFSIAWVHSLIIKNISISIYSVYLNSYNSNNSLLYKYRFYLHTVTCQNSSILNNSVKCKYSFNVKNSLIQTIQFSISTQFKCKYTFSSSKTSLFQAIHVSQTVLIPTIQFSISMQFSSI